MKLHILTPGFGAESVKPALQSVFASIQRMAARSGAGRMSPPRAVGIRVLELERDPVRLQAALLDEASQAVEHDDADVIVLGCTGMLGGATHLQRALAAACGCCIPVVDPLPAAAALAIATVRHRQVS